MMGRSSTKRTLRASLVGAGIVCALSMMPETKVPGIGVRTAKAVVGRPLTPVSYAGVARRSSRRVARRTAYRTSAYTSTLPAGCAGGGVYYSCGGHNYTPAYSGTSVVYVEAD